ncbi:MAG: aminotransferase class IV [Bacteroidales bacterium]
MSLLLESIRIEEGEVMNFDYHIDRMVRSVIAAGYSTPASFPGKFIPESSVPPVGLHKCRVLYNSEIVSCGVSPYYMKEIKTLKVIQASRPDYALKYADRSVLNGLLGMRGDCDDILIVSDDAITDASYCNVAFEKEGLWHTPEEPLLKGTMRQYLLDTGVIVEADIRLSQISNFGSIKLFNAMVPWERAWQIDIKNILI